MIKKLIKAAWQLGDGKDLYGEIGQIRHKILHSGGIRARSFAQTDKAAIGNGDCTQWLQRHRRKSGIHMAGKVWRALPALPASRRVRQKK